MSQFDLQLLPNASVTLEPLGTSIKNPILIVIVNNSELSKKVARHVSHVASATPSIRYGIRALTPTEQAVAHAPRLVFFQDGKPSEYTGIQNQQSIQNYVLSL